MKSSRDEEASMEARYQEQDSDGSPGGPCRREFHHPSVAASVAWQLVKTAGILAPLIITELVKDNDRRWRLIRISSVGTALLSQALYTSRVTHDRWTDRVERSPEGQRQR